MKFKRSWVTSVSKRSSLDWAWPLLSGSSKSPEVEDTLWTETGSSEVAFTSVDDVTGTCTCEPISDDDTTGVEFLAAFADVEDVTGLVLDVIVLQDGSSFWLDGKSWSSISASYSLLTLVIWYDFISLWEIGIVKQLDSSLTALDCFHFKFKRKTNSSLFIMYNNKFVSPEKPHQHQSSFPEGPSNIITPVIARYPFMPGWKVANVD